MDIISLNEASTANGRIENFIENPDSTSGVLTVPKTIAAGETITIPTGRVAILPDLQVDGDLVIDGDLFIPTGSMTSQVVQKVTSTDNAIVRFDGVTGQVQNSGVTIDDNDMINLVYSNTDARGYKQSKGSWYGRVVPFSQDGTMLLETQYAGNGGGFRFNVDGAERMRIDSAGNVGIGTTPSAWMTTAENRQTLQIKNGAISATTASIEMNNNLYRDSSYGNKYLSNGHASFYGQGSDGGHRWYVAPSGTAGNAITWTNAMTLGSNGNLLLGTTIDNGVDKLQVNGSISARGISNTIAPDYLNADISNVGVIWLDTTGSVNFPDSPATRGYVVVNPIVASDNGTKEQVYYQANTGHKFTRFQVGMTWTSWKQLTN